MSFVQIKPQCLLFTNVILYFFLLRYPLIGKFHRYARLMFIKALTRINDSSELSKINLRCECNISHQHLLIDLIAYAYSWYKTNKLPI